MNLDARTRLARVMNPREAAIFALADEREFILNRFRALSRGMTLKELQAYNPGITRKTMSRLTAEGIVAPCRNYFRINEDLMKGRMSDHSTPCHMTRPTDVNPAYDVTSTLYYSESESDYTIVASPECLEPAKPWVYSAITGGLQPPVKVKFPNERWRK